MMADWEREIAFNRWRRQSGVIDGREARKWRRRFFLLLLYAIVTTVVAFVK